MKRKRKAAVQPHRGRLLSLLVTMAALIALALPGLAHGTR
jgi:hypothetical protein